MTHAQQLVQAIRSAGRRGMTDGDLEVLRISACPWKRLGESAHRHLKPGEQLVRKVGRNGLKRWALVRARG